MAKVTKRIIVVILVVALTVVAALQLSASQCKTFYFNGNTATAEIQNSGTSAGAATYSNGTSTVTATITGSYLGTDPNGNVTIRSCGNASGRMDNTAATYVTPFNAPAGTTFFLATSSHTANDGIGSGSCSLTETYP